MSTTKCYKTQWRESHGIGKKTPNLVRWKNSYQIYLNLLQPLRNYARNPAVCTQRRDRTSNISRNPSIHFTDREEQKKKKTGKSSGKKRKKERERTKGWRGEGGGEGKNEGKGAKRRKRDRGSFIEFAWSPGASSTRAISKGGCARLTEKDYAYLGSSSPLKRISLSSTAQTERRANHLLSLPSLSSSRFHSFHSFALLMPVKKTGRRDEREECQNSGIGIGWQVKGQGEVHWAGSIGVVLSTLWPDVDKRGQATPKETHTDGAEGGPGEAVILILSVPPRFTGVRKIETLVNDDEKPAAETDVYIRKRISTNARQGPQIHLPRWKSPNVVSRGKSISPWEARG